MCLAACNVGSADIGWVIYGLRTVGDHHIRYVGLTTVPMARRFYLHIWNTKKLMKFPVQKWMHSHDYKIEWTILEQCPVDNPEYLGYAERYWIASLKDAGHKLLNCNDGGWGGVNMNFTDEWRADQSRRMSGEGNPMYGKKFTDEHRANISKGLLGKPSWSKGVTFSDEHRANISKNHARLSGPDASFFGKTHTDEAKAKISAVHRGKTLSEETKKKMSVARKGKSNPAASTSNHKRYHVSKGITKPDTCKYCRED